MSVVVAVKKDNQISIASDSQSSNGSLIISGKRKKNHSKLFRIGKNIIGTVGWQATDQIIEHTILTSPKLFKLSSRQKIFETLLALQEVFKEKYFIKTEEDDDEQPVDSNQITGLIINQQGLFEIESYRGVTEYNDFWAIGSGQDYALGAINALYTKNYTASEIAREGILAAIEFNSKCGPPVEIESLTV